MAVSIQFITEELMLACRQRGHVVPETLAMLVVSTVVNPETGTFFVERPLDESDSRTVVQEAAKRLLAEGHGFASLRLQASYEMAFDESEQKVQKRDADAKSAQDSLISHISGFVAKFDHDFDALNALYKKVFQLLMLKSTGPHGESKPSSDVVVQREVAAALESVFPRVGLRPFVALTGPEKVANLEELASIVLGIRLFNQYQKKGGTNLPSVEEALLRVSPDVDALQKEINSDSELCKKFVTLIQSRSDSASDEIDEDLERYRTELLYHRQRVCYLHNHQEVVMSSIETVKRELRLFTEQLIDLDALISGRVSVPKEHVYPRFDLIARGYRASWTALRTLESRAKLCTTLQEHKSEYHPEPPVGEIGTHRVVSPSADDLDELDALPGPDEAEVDGPVRLTAQNAQDFLQVPLDFQGFCVHTLVSTRVLVSGDPSFGVVSHAGRHCAFASPSALLEFFSKPDHFFSGVREVCYLHPELIHLLRVGEDFPRSCLSTIIQNSRATSQADEATECPTHVLESHIDKSYEWNEWKLRKEALHMANVKGKATSATQTALSHLRRENESQVYPQREVATNTVVNHGTNPPRWKKYVTGLRGESQPMGVVNVKFDL